jgi:hypothetical protein
MKKQQPRFFATYNQRVTAYQKSPALLAEDLLIIFGLIREERDKCLVDAGAHNIMVKKLIEFCPNVESMLVNVAKAIVRTSKECHNPKTD